MAGRKRTMFTIDNATVIHPAAVYMFRTTMPGIIVNPYAPIGVTHACSAGPTA